MRVVHLGVAGAAEGADHRVDAAATGHPDVEAGGLGAEAGVGAHAVRGAGVGAGAARLLVGVGAEDDVAGEVRAQPRDRLEREQHAGDAALHVAAAAAVELAVADLRARAGGSSSCSSGSSETASMWPLRRSERPPPAPRRRAASCGRPTKSSPSGTTRLPVPVGSGSQTSRRRRARRAAGAGTPAAPPPAAPGRRRCAPWCRTRRGRSRAPRAPLALAHGGHHALLERRSKGLAHGVSSSVGPGETAGRACSRPARPRCCDNATSVRQRASLRRQLAEGDADVDALLLADGLPDEVPDDAGHPRRHEQDQRSCPGQTRGGVDERVVEHAR